MDVWDSGGGGPARRMPSLSHRAANRDDFKARRRALATTDTGRRRAGPPSVPGLSAACDGAKSWCWHSKCFKLNCICPCHGPRTGA